MRRCARARPTTKATPAADGRRLVVALNLSAEPRPVPSLGPAVLSTLGGPIGDADVLRPDEGRITVG